MTGRNLAIIIPMTNIEVAKRIDELRVRRHLTQNEFCHTVLAVSQSAASKKLRGQIPFTSEEVVKCADFFGVSTDEIYGRGEGRNKDL